MKNKKMVWALIFLLEIVIALVMIKKFMAPSIDSYYEEGLSPEEVIEKYYDGCNDYNENKVRSTLANGKEKNVYVIFDKDKKFEVCSINEDARLKEDYIKYGKGTEDNRDNIKAYKVNFKEIDLRDKTESCELWRNYCLEKNEEGNWFITDGGE